MNITFPFGFFETLSKKCQEEIKQKANEFTYIKYSENKKYFFYSQNNQRYDNTKSIVKYNKKCLLINQNYLDEEQERLKQIYDLEKIQEEYEKLKKSISNIKEFIK